MRSILYKYIFFFAILCLAVILLIGVSYAVPAENGGDGATTGFEVPLPAIPGVDPEAGLPSFVHYIYLLLLGIGGALAFTMIVVAGLQWSLSSVSPALQSDARERIKYAIGGLVLLLSSFVILNTINPDLVALRAPGLNLPVIEDVAITQPQQIRCPVGQYACVSTTGRVLSCYLSGIACAASCVAPPPGLVPLPPRGTCEVVQPTLVGGPTPIESAPPTDADRDIRRMNESARESLGNMQACAATLRGANVRITSTYRSSAYQNHLREIFCKYQCVVNGRDPQAVSNRQGWGYANYCGAFVNFPCSTRPFDEYAPQYHAAVRNIKAAWQLHGISTPPENIGSDHHAWGCAVDMAVSGINPEKFGFVGRVAEYATHFEFRGCTRRGITGLPVYAPVCDDGVRLRR